MDLQRILPGSRTCRATLLLAPVAALSVAPTAGGCAFRRRRHRGSRGGAARAPTPAK